MAYGRDRTVIPVSIPNGGSLSAEVAVNGMRIVGIQMPAGWDAASITFAALTRRAPGPPEVLTFGKVQAEGGTEVTVTTPAADVYVALSDAVAASGLGRVRVRSGTAAAPVNQTAQRDFFLVCVAD